MADRTLASKLCDISDQLCTINDLNEAIHMAATDPTVLDSARGALQAICAVIDAKVNSVKHQIDELVEDMKA